MLKKDNQIQHNKQSFSNTIIKHFIFFLKMILKPLLNLKFQLDWQIPKEKLSIHYSLAKDIRHGTNLLLTQEHYPSYSQKIHCLQDECRRTLSIAHLNRVKIQWRPPLDAGESFQRSHQISWAAQVKYHVIIEITYPMLYWKSSLKEFP